MYYPAENPWLVLRTRSNHENKVEVSLKQKQITAYLPKYRIVRNSPTRKASIEVPLFPGYIFVRPRVEQFADILYIRGSCGLVLRGDKPAPMPEKDLESVRVLVGSGAELAVVPKLMPGQRVQVIAGPFAGVQGELVNQKSQERLVINACLLGSSVSVEVSSSNVMVL